MLSLNDLPIGWYAFVSTENCDDQESFGNGFTNFKRTWLINILCEKFTEYNMALAYGSQDNNIKEIESSIFECMHYAGFVLLPSTQYYLQWFEQNGSEKVKDMRLQRLEMMGKISK